MDGRTFSKFIRRITDNDPSLVEFSLGFFDTCLSNQKLIDLGTALVANTHLENLDLSGCVIDAGVFDLARGLKKNKGLRQLNLTRVQFGHLSYPFIIFNKLPRDGSLRHLQLGSLSCSGYSRNNRRLLTTFQPLVNTVLANLSNVFSGFNQDDLFQTLESYIDKIPTSYGLFLTNLPKLESLSINSSFNELDAIGLYIYLIGDTSLKKLKLAHSHFSQSQFKQIADGLTHAEKLEFLDLSFTSLNDLMITDLCNALSENSTIKSINLTDTAITKTGLESILAVIQENPHIHFLYHSFSKHGTLGTKVEEALYNNRLKNICQQIINAELIEQHGMVSVGNFTEIKKLIEEFMQDYPESSLAKLILNLFVRFQYIGQYGTSAIDSFALNNIGNKEVELAFRMLSAHLASIRGDFLYTYCVYHTTQVPFSTVMTYRFASAAMIDNDLAKMLTPLQRRQMALILCFSDFERLQETTTLDLMSRLLKDDKSLTNPSLIQITGASFLLDYVSLNSIIKFIQRTTPNEDFQQLKFSINTEQEFQAWLLLIRTEVANLPPQTGLKASILEKIKTILKNEHIRCYELIAIDPIAARDPSQFPKQNKMDAQQAFRLLNAELRARHFSNQDETIETRFNKLKQELHQILMDNISFDLNDDTDYVEFILQQAEKAITNYQSLPRDLSSFSESHLSLPALLFTSNVGVTRAQTYSQLLSNSHPPQMRMAALYYLLKYTGGKKIKECIYDMLGSDELLLSYIATYLTKQAQSLDLSQLTLQKTLGLK